MTVADFIIRLKNGYMAKRDSVDVPYSKLNESMLTKLKALKYINDYDIEGDKKRTLKVKLKYDEDVAAITDVKIFSRPGRRWYVNYKDIRPVLGGMGTSLVSTSKGVMTAAETKKNRIGGELLFSVW
ncbi:30S ribosomal protein S8 [Candidatus Roizmanbacteria bacterium RIFCSPLOWO2_01_FULL_38_12]|uniref:Small ribosomal subunit protein uS8 n=1 Tax=Candidatus Roizmanbacteria bacterium RIFCSPLOWO2_01_FULL_38_12 TaxID=1802061 RepID=A0A1F7IY04_9BACT|nr:MAG: 30S ribosomal protein S8 [Candidatus Roizmanbacteria bacterium RIFCSPHIGHO2_01_FULL_38_15]OGK35892.1 MAG: 30S ribosomal protein S8 [Candidatus Roizmanbacteria bacterium RIFCSPHIGHO2_12_FULL_38_13]OGK48243.1 MAG: 30S ribosomal protein S8 [Candidatus Roizmanbacteria bacterium RIFCSPLOWO2_01_FULL_38_12]